MGEPAGRDRYGVRMVRPVIGILPTTRTAAEPTGTRRHSCPAQLRRCGPAAGAIALMLPPTRQSCGSPILCSTVIDGLMLAGGADIDPSAYGEPPHPKTVETVPGARPLRTCAGASALERDIPFLGICRGMQVMNIACGGSLTRLRSASASRSPARCRAPSTAPTTTCASPRARSRRAPPASRSTREVAPSSGRRSNRRRARRQRLVGDGRVAGGD